MGRVQVQGSFRFGLLASAVSVSAVYKTLAIGVMHPFDLFLSWALDTALWAWLWLASEALVRGPGGPRRRHATEALLFYAPFYASFLCSFAHDYFFASAAERRLSLVDVDWSVVAFFFTRVLPAKGWVELVGLLLVIHCGAWLLSKRNDIRMSARGVLLATAALTLTAGIVGALAPRVPWPLFDIAHDFWELASTPRIEIDRSAKSRLPFSILDKSANAHAGVADPPLSPFKKVLVFVMETMTADKFESERARLAPTSFVRASRAHAHTYGNYYPNNQDSRTGMLDMLSSRLIPYEAYTEEGRDHYRYLAREPSLVDRFRALGYTTVFAVSQTDVEIVVGDLPWNHTISLSEADIRQARPDHLCFVPYEFEHGCEDSVLLPRIFELIDRNDRVFLYQEFIWGHDIAYNAASGKTNTEYYSSYLDSVIAHLERQGLLDQTLIVLTSDHGFRDKGLQGELSVYRIPLLFFSPRLQASNDERLFSHIDFKDLLLHELSPGSAAVDSNPFVMIVGTTGTGMLTVLTRERDFMLFKNRGGQHYLLRHRLLPDAAGTQQDPASLLQLFETYRDHFDALGKR